MDSLNPSKNAVQSVPDKEAGDRQTEQPVSDMLKTDQQENANGPAQTKKKKRPTKHFVRISNLIIQGLLLFVGLGYSWFAWQQWTVMNKQLQMSRLDQRAWVAPSAIEGKPEQDKPFNILITVKNSGKTFALEFKLLAAFKSQELADPTPDFDADLARAVKDIPDKQINSFGLISPQGAFTSTIKASSDKKLTKDEMLEITSPTRVMFVFGKI